VEYREPKKKDLTEYRKEAEEKKQKISQTTRRHTSEDRNAEEQKCSAAWPYCCGERDHAALRMSYGDSGIREIWLH
jgi:hypothetical protein